MYQHRFFTTTIHTLTQSGDTLLACLLSVKSRSPPKTAPKTSSPLSPLTCHSAFLCWPPDWIFLSFFLLFSSDICSIQRLHHGTTIVLFSTHILVLTCHIFGGFGILAPDLNLDIFWIKMFEIFLVTSQLNINLVTISNLKIITNPIVRTNSI